ncbi:unnamed protein product [Ectocarpus sp. 12 AP-2014]
MAVIDSLGRGGYRLRSTSLGANPATAQRELLRATSHMREMAIRIVLSLVDCHSMIDSLNTLPCGSGDTSYLVVCTNTIRRRLCSTANSEGSSSWISREVLKAPCQHLRWRLRRRNVWNPPVPSTFSSHRQNSTSLGRLFGHRSSISTKLSTDCLVIAPPFQQSYQQLISLRLVAPNYRPCRRAPRPEQRARSAESPPPPAQENQKSQNNKQQQSAQLVWLAHTTSGESSSYTPNETIAVGGAH